MGLPAWDCLHGTACMGLRGPTWVAQHRPDSLAVAELRCRELEGVGGLRDALHDAYCYGMPSLVTCLPTLLACVAHTLLACVAHTLLACVAQTLLACVAHTLLACVAHTLLACVAQTLLACVAQTLLACVAHPPRPLP